MNSGESKTHGSFKLDGEDRGVVSNPRSGSEHGHSASMFQSHMPPGVQVVEKMTLSVP